MAEATIPVDPFNPGQVFACLGFVEATEALLGNATGRFAWKGEDNAAEFALFVDEGNTNPVVEILRFLKECKVEALRPSGTGFNLESKSKSGIETSDFPSMAFPIDPDIEKAGLVALLRDGDERTLQLDYWGTRPGIDAAKFWGGNVTAPGLAQYALKCLAKLEPEPQADDPFAFAVPQTGSFRLDWRRDYVPLDAGFSPNPHSHVVMMGFPVVEILAAIGLTHARPGKDDRLHYRYGVLGGSDRLPPSLLRAALTGAASPVPGAPFRRFRMTLGSPGQEGQARCITDVQELPEEFIQ